MRLFTVGHGARKTEELVAVLHSAGVGRLIDVRRYPGSRRHPHLSRDALTADLPPFDLEYEWWGEELGGRRKPADPTRHPEWRDPGFQGYADYMDTPAFESGLARLLTEAEHEPPLAVMCAETLWWRCHRRMIADAAVSRGAEVVHILDVGKLQVHPVGLV